MDSSCLWQWDLRDEDRFKNAIPILQSMLKVGRNIDVRDNYNRTPLHLVLSGIDEVFDESSYGCIVKYSKKITTPEQREEIVRFLIKNGADIDAVDSFGMNALAHVVKGKLGEHTLKMVKYLFECNAKLDIHTKAGLNVFAYARIAANTFFGRYYPLCTDSGCKFCNPESKYSLDRSEASSSCVENYLYDKAGIK